MQLKSGLAALGAASLAAVACSSSDEPQYADEPAVEESSALEPAPSVDGTAAEPAAAANSLSNRPTTVTAVVSNNYGRYEGTYTSSQISRICGETDPAGLVFPERMFLLEFPLDLPPNPSMSDFSFHSRKLVGSVTETDQFFASVAVITASGGAPPAFVIDTERANSEQTGRASLSVEDGAATLTVRGKDETIGWTLEITAVCHPPQ